MTGLMVAVLASTQLALRTVPPDSTMPPAAAAVAQAVRATAEGPRLDGRLDDADWLRAPVIDGFVQREPSEGRPGSERTEVRVVYTDAALYVGIRAHDAQAARIAAPLVRRDESASSDWLGVMIDSYHDRRTAFEFAVNPAGVQRDVYRHSDTEEDATWNAAWEVATSRDDAGWTAEFRIPFSQLRFAGGGRLRFGFNLYRRIQRLNELQYWRLLPQGRAATVSLFGDLDGIEGVRPPRQLEVTPYLVGRGTHDAAETGDPFRTGTASAGTLGADIKFGVTPSLTLSAALNPDFGQVEADPAEVNLSAFETFRAEQRPFFAEAADVFRFPVAPSPAGVEQLFYTRRIGRRPQLEADERGGFAEAVDATTILGTAKLSGKTPSGWAVGLLAAATAEEAARVRGADGAAHRDVVEPASQYVVGRLAREMRGGRTVVGLYGTAVRRDLPASVADELRSGAYTVGIDLSHRFRRDTYAMRAWLVGSHVRGTTGAIDETQRSSVRYLQRPGNDAMRYDPTRTSLSGLAAQLQVGKHAGDWIWSAQATTRTPGFEANDLGFQFWAGRVFQDGYIGRRWLTPGRLFRSMDLRLGESASYTLDGDRINAGVNLTANFVLPNYWSGFAALWHRAGGIDPTSLRGGPAIPFAGNVFGEFQIDTDARRPLRFGLGMGHWNYYGSRTEGVELFPSVSWRPSSRSELTVGSRFSRFIEDHQYIETIEATGGDEYLVGELQQTIAAVTLRGDLIFTPRLSLQLYAEPFVSSGRYTGFRRVADPGAERAADRFDPLGDDRLARSADALHLDLDRDGTPEARIEDPDFTQVSFRSNLVLRWEYRPASTLFVVWQQSREDEHLLGRFALDRSLGDLGAAPARNALIVKLSYWWSLR